MIMDNSSSGSSICILMVPAAMLAEIPHRILQHEKIVKQRGKQHRVGIAPRHKGSSIHRHMRALHTDMMGCQY